MKKITLSHSDYKLLYQIFSMKEKTLLQSAAKVVVNFYEPNKIHFTRNFIYAEGTIPIALVCHLDTVHSRPVQKLFHDQSQTTLWSPDGLGADDRAGVFGIFKILEAGYLPTVIFCCQEEVGGRGAKALIEKFPKPLSKINFMIELDRQGRDDAVFYDCDNPEFEEYITKFDFVSDWGTYSDISTIAPSWECAAVNLSIGYFDEHSYAEHLNYTYMFQTIEKVKKILDAELVEEHPFKYIPIISSERGWDLYFKHKYGTLTTVKCDGCGQMVDSIYSVPVFEGSQTLHYCSECMDLHLDWCYSCGEPYRHHGEHNTLYCPDCRRKYANKKEDDIRV